MIPFIPFIPPPPHIAEIHGNATFAIVIAYCHLGCALAMLILAIRIWWRMK